MTLEDLENIGEFVGAIAVVVTLVYLAIQIRQNTRAVRSTTHQAMHDAFLLIATSTSEDPGLATLIAKANRNYKDLTEEERIRFYALASRVFTNYENVYFQRAVVDPEMWEAWDAAFRRLAEAPAMRHHWGVQGPACYGPFREYVDNQVYGTSE